ncbi:hypothetical protein ES703_112947 [subsurface metagenome]
MIREEKMKVLTMIQEGKITAEEGAKLLEVLDEGDSGLEQASASGQGKNIKIKVSELDSGTVKVNLNLPLGIARFVKSFIPQEAKDELEARGIDLEALMSTLDSGAVGKLVEVEDEQDRHRIEIWIE